MMLISQINIVLNVVNQFCLKIKMLKCWMLKIILKEKV